MISSDRRGLRVLKIFNNSVVLGRDTDGREVVLLGRGIGFQKSPGDGIDQSMVEKQFVPGHLASGDRLEAYLSEIPAADLALAQDVVAAAQKVLGSQVSDHVLFPLADHLSFAIRRVNDGEALEYPLKWEVASLYPREVAFGRAVLGMVKESRGVQLADAEAIPLALHFVNAQFGAADMSETARVTAALTASLDLLRERLAVAVSDDSPDTARFVTHLRYLIARCLQDTPVAAIDPSVGAALRAANEAEYATAVVIAEMLERRFQWSVGESERLYLTIHVSRLAATNG